MRSTSFGGTRENGYVSCLYNLRSGNLELVAKAPTYRAQHDVARNGYGVSDGSEQVRYWAICASQGTRPTDCIRDENAHLDANGYFHVVIAPSCPVADHQGWDCLRGGKLSAAGLGAAPLLLYRNTLPSESFGNDAGPKVCPETTEPSEFCGEYQLRANYVPRP
jgi:hypothetical protein